MLKGRFQSLRGIRTPIGSSEDHAKVAINFEVCCILHNLLVNDYYDQNWTEEEDEHFEKRGETAAEADGKQRRESLKEFVLRTAK